MHSEQPSLRRSWQGFAALAGVFFLLAVLLIALWRGGNGGAGTAPDTLVVGDQRGGAEALLRAAGELDNLPYHIKFALFPAASPLLEALNAEAVDVGGIGAAPFAFAYASGARIRAVHAYRPDGTRGSRASAIIVRHDAPFHRLGDLKGRKIATIKGSAGQNLVLRLLARAGMKASDVQWVYLANGESKAALASGSVDAWSTWGSYVGIATLENGDRVLADAAGLPAEVGFYAANDKAIASKHALLGDYFRRLARARLWANGHSEQYAAVLARETGIPLNVALFTAENYRGNPVRIDQRVVDDQKAIFERYRDAGIIASLPRLEGAYDPRFNDAVTP